MDTLLDCFLRYVKIETTADERSALSRGRNRRSPLFAAAALLSIGFGGFGCVQFSHQPVFVGDSPTGQRVCISDEHQATWGLCRFVWPSFKNDFYLNLKPRENDYVCWAWPGTILGVSEFERYEHAHRWASNKNWRLHDCTVRGDAKRIWLVSSEGATIASADLGSNILYPEGTPQPEWARANAGVELANRVEEFVQRPDPFKPFPAPDFTSKTADGDEFKLADTRGKVVALDFFGVNCGPCRAQTPHLIALHERYKDKGLVVAAVNAWNDWASSVREYAADLHIPYPVLLKGREQAHALDPENSGVPVLVWIDRKGQVAQIDHGFGGEDDVAGLTRTAERLLAAP